MEAREQERIKYKIEQRKADEEITHATGRVLFWLHHAIVKGEHNGELEEAFENLQRAEAHKKKWTEKFWPNTALIRRNYLWNYLTFKTDSVPGFTGCGVDFACSDFGYCVSVCQA